MTPAEIREYVINHGGPTDQGLGVYINYTRPVLALARAVHGNNAELENLLFRDLDPLEAVDPLAHVINRICGSFNLNVETIGSFLLDAGRTEQVAATVSGASGLNLMLFKDDAEPPAGQMSFFLHLAEPFELYYEYPLFEGTVQFSHAPSEQVMISGSNSQGRVVFKSCLVTQRDQSYRPLSIEVEGEMTGTLELAEMFSPPWPAFFDSTFIMTAMIQGVSDSDPLWQVLESQCIGSVDP